MLTSFYKFVIPKGDELKKSEVCPVVYKLQGLHRKKKSPFVAFQNFM